jgi:acyl-CoA thioesterase I
VRHGCMRTHRSLAILAVLGLTLARAAGETPAPGAATPPVAAVVRVACVGDSITFGSGLKDRATQAYPAVLGRILGPGFEVGNFGVSGATMLRKGNRPYWEQGRFAAADEFHPAIVVIKLGTNDSKTENWPAHGDEFADDAVALVTHFQGLPTHPRVWICLPVPVTKTTWTINEPTTSIIRERLRAVAARTGAGLIDPTPAFLAQPERLPDGVHPDAGGAVLLAATVASALISAP